MIARMLLAGALALASCAASAAALLPVQVTHAWVRWLPANLPSAGYATLTNTGDSLERLTGADSPAYAQISLHRSRLDESDSTMVAVTHLDIPAHHSVQLSPGGYHLMLMHATQPLQPGDQVPLTLHFASGAKVRVVFSVLPANSTGPTD